MAKTIFFSWQSDTPNKVGRTFLKDVLEEVCKMIELDTSIDEAVRNISVDSDTQGVAGQPPIVETILKKIESAGVIVADMTFVGTRQSKKLPTPNPNVLIEYGYALKALTHSRTISVMNTFYGEPSRENLPFDLAHVAWPIRYHLSEDASPTQRSAEKKRLVSILSKSVRASIATIKLPPVEQIHLFEKAKAKDGPAFFRASGEELGFFEGFGSQSIAKVFLKKDPAIWLRIMPIKPTEKTFTTLKIKDVALHSEGRLILSNLIRASGDWLRAEDGWGLFTPITISEFSNDANNKEAQAVTFVFESGEIWAIDTAWLANSEYLFYPPKDLFEGHLEEYAYYLDKLGIPGPYHWEAGMTGLKGRKFNYPVRPGYLRLPGHEPICLKETLQDEGRYELSESTAKVLSGFYNKMFDACGVERPTYLL